MRLKITLFFLLISFLKSVDCKAQSTEIADFTKVTAHLIKNFPETNINEKLILVSFWSSENFESRSGNLDLMEIWNIYKAAHLKNGRKGVVFYAVSADTDKVKWDIACKKDGMARVINFCDGKGMSSELISDLNVKSLPHNILFDSNGKVIAVNLKTQEVIKTVFNQQITRD